MKFDIRTEKCLKSLDPKAEPRFRKWLEDAVNVAIDFDCELKLISGNRTWEEQNELYAQGRTKPGKIVTNARGGQSLHNFGIAVDAGVFQGSKYLDESNPKLAARVHKEVAKDVASYGFEWGGTWEIGDYPHTQIDTGLITSQLRAKYKKFGSVL